MSHSRIGARPWRTALATAALLAGVAVAPATAQSPATSGGALVSPNCGTEPVELLAYFETGFDLPTKLSDGVHQAVPERDLEHPQ